MKNHSYQASLIIPTHNRADRLPRALNALNEQKGDSSFEVIIVADGCHDNTAEVVKQFPAAYPLRLLEQPASGPATARNAGAALAQAPLLIFIDDDIETSSGFVNAHIMAHEKILNGVVLGYLPPVVRKPGSLFGANLRLWWENMFTTMQQPGHRFAYTDLLSGNFSLSKQLFEQVGKFDTNYWCHEDYELGYRLITAGAQFVFSSDAWGYHHEITTASRSLRRKYDEGKADIQLAKQYPDIIPQSFLSRLYSDKSIPGRTFRHLAFRTPKLGDIVMGGFEKLLYPLETMRLRSLWQKIIYGLMAYWYWRGVSQMIPTLSKLDKFVPKPQKPNKKSALCINLIDGIETAEAEIDEARPSSLHIFLGEHEIGHLPAKPGAERLHKGHLRPLLATHWPVQLLRALTLEEKLPHLYNEDRLLSTYDRVMMQKETSEAWYDDH